MAKILDTKSIYYNDVNLIAQPSSLISRSEVLKELNRIIVSPMDAIVGKTFALKANQLGLTVCLHRFCSIEKECEIFDSLPNKNNVFVSVGALDTERVKQLSKVGATNFLLDIANGYIANLRILFYDIKQNCNLKKFMVGNVMTGNGFYNAVNLENDTFVRVGIAGGSACKTSDESGYNRGNVTELLEVNEEKKRLNSFTSSYNTKCYIVADGGIKNGNYAMKAFGCGADYCMMGGYFRNAEEAETNIIGDGTYWGGASYKQQERYGRIKKHSEGKVLDKVEKLVSLETLINELWGGISSGISYSGYRSLTDFIGNGTFEIKENSLPPKNR